MIRLPPIKIAQGEPFAHEITVTGRDWTGYTGEVLFKVKPKDEDSLVTVTATGTSLGVITFSLTEDEVALLPALDVIDYRVTCIYQVRMDGASPETLQGRVGVASAL